MRRVVKMDIRELKQYKIDAILGAIGAFLILVFQIIFVLIPDIRQAFGADISTWDFVLSQGSGNAALCIWMIVNAVWAGKKAKKEG